MINVSKQNIDIIFECLSNNHKTSEPEKLPEYSSQERFCEWNGLSFVDSSLSWLNFRLLVIGHFMDFVAKNEILSKHITFNAKAKELCKACLTGVKSPTDIWFTLLPKTRSANKQRKEKMIFQTFKHTSASTVKENLLIVGVKDVLKSFMVEDVLELLGAIEPSLIPLFEKPQKHPEETHPGGAILYNVLNTHINWINFNRRHIINTGMLLEKPPNESLPVNDLRCGECQRLLTTRKQYRGGNPKHTGTMYSIDNHSFISSCCESRVFLFPLVVDKTILSVHIQGVQEYHMAQSGEKIEISTS